MPLILRPVTVIGLLLLAGTLCAEDACHPAIKTPADAAEVRRQLAGMQAMIANATDRKTVLYVLSTAQAHLGDWEAAYKTLNLADSEGDWFDPSGEPAFQPVLNCQIVRRVVARVHAHHPAVATAKLWRAIAQPDLIPEGLAVDSASGEFYMSSIYHRKIIRIARDGAVHDFIAPGQDGTLSVLGIRVDPRDHSVWANSEFDGKSWLHHWDHSGKLIARYAPDANAKGDHLFNDLIVTRVGDVYLTDSSHSSLFKLPHGEKDLQRIAVSNAFYLNGIAVSDDQQRLYFSDAFDTFVMDLTTNAIRRLAPPKGESIAGFDGLYFYHGSLVGIQNGVGTPRVLQAKLSPDGNEVLSIRTLEYRSPLVETPTTGAIYKKNFYFMANTQSDQEQNGKITDPAKLKPVRIVVVPLPSAGK